MSQASNSTDNPLSKSHESEPKKVTNGTYKDIKPISGKLGTVTDKPKSLQKDSSKSSAYKSLFTSSEKAKGQAKGHWVTYNPCYY